MVDPQAMKCGKQPPEIDARTLRLAAFTPEGRPPLPEACDWTTAARDKWGGMLNVHEPLNDCTIAAAGHMIQTWTANSASEITVSDAQILAAYKEISGYDGRPVTDNGAACLKVLSSWRNKGIGDHRIQAFVKLDLKNRNQLKEAVYVFGGAYVGFALPRSALAQAGRPKSFPRETWSVPERGTRGPGQPGTWELHCVCIVAYTPTVCTFVSWGHLWTMTWDFYETYCDEAYAALSADWLDSTKHAPNHIDLQKLQEELNRLKHRKKQKP